MADGRPPSYPTGGDDVHRSASSSQTVTLEGALRLYERGGDAAASLRACQSLWAAPDAAPSASEEGEKPILSRRHNEAVLQHLASLQSAGREPDTNESEELPAILSSVLSVSGGAANDTGQGHNDLVGLYNICLSHYAAGRYREALDAILGPFLSATKSIVVDDEGVKLTVGGEAVKADATGALSPVAYLAVTTRIAFLLLDCQLALDGGNGTGIGLIVANKGEDEVSITADKILAWVEKNSLALTAKGDDVLGREGYETMKHEELKFRLHLYRSRMLFAGNKESGEDLEQRSRTARKELKNAMDIFQNVLCVDGDGKEHGKRGKQKGSNPPPIASIKGKGNQDLSETTSVTSAAGGSLGGDSEVKGGLGAAGATFEGMPSSPIEPLNEKVKKDTPALQVRHESALYLKANLEQLRGNPAKSLKLCTEARLAGRNSRALGHDNEGGTDDGPEADYDEAIYHNNMGLLHQSAGKVHLALQYYSYALSYMERAKATDSSSRGHHFWPDGVARPDVTAEILHNKAICAFQAQDFGEAYKCMARCVNMAPNVFGQRARCWLRLAQSCIGIHAGMQQPSDSSEGSSIDASNSFDIGSDEDLNSISSQPLQKAALCLAKAINLSCGNSDNTDVDFSNLPSPKDGSANTDVDCYEAALVALAYVKLQMEDNSGALKLCERALRENGEKSAPSAQLREMADMYSREATIRAAG